MLATNASEMTTYLYTPVSMTGPTITPLGLLEIKDNGDMVVEALSTALTSGQTPMMLNDGVVTAYSPSGSLASVYLATHDALALSGAVSPLRMKAAIAQSIALMRLSEAWDIACRLNDGACWRALSGKAMETLNIEFAKQVYRQVGDAGMVAALETIRRLEDRRAVAGNIALLFGDFPLAQDLLLGSSQPLLALDMRKDLLQWDTALKLAETLAPDQVSAISLEYAKQLEFKGEYAYALSMYQAAAARVGSISASNPAEVTRIQGAVQSGLARMTIRQGDVRKGMQLAMESGDKQLCRECGAILER